MDEIREMLCKLTIAQKEEIIRLILEAQENECSPESGGAFPSEGCQEAIRSHH